MISMAPEDLEIAGKLRESDPEFKMLWDEHLSLKKRLKELTNKDFLTSDEEAEIKKIKRTKLLGKDKMAMKINQYKVVVPSG